MNKKFFAGLRTGCVMWVLLLVAVSCQTASKRGGVNISPRLAEEEIRLEILQYTPAGSTAEQVLEFVRARLRHLGPEPEGVSGRSIKVCLGEFGFPARAATFISWSFDDRDRMIDLNVHKERDSL